MAGAAWSYKHYRGLRIWGAFFCIVSAKELGFTDGLRNPDKDPYNKATKLLKAAVNANKELRQLFKHPEHENLGFFYSIIIVDDELGKPAPSSKGAETGLCYLADQQVDRSPTGSGVAARAALAYANSARKTGEAWTYHSLVSNLVGTGQSGFVGTVCSEEAAVAESAPAGSFPIVRVKVEGYTWYTGFHTFIREPSDVLGSGRFVLQ